jgi:hypothetical protein
MGSGSMHGQWQIWQQCITGSCEHNW